MTDFATINADGWDAEDWATTCSTFPALHEAEMGLLDLSSVGPDLLGDVFHIFHKAQPTARDEVHPRAAVNQQITTGLLDGQLDQLRAHTVGDQVIAGASVAAMVPTLMELLDQVSDAQEAADEAGKAQDDYEEACDQAGEQPGADHADEQLGELAAAAAAAQAAATEAIGNMGPVVDRAVRAGLEAAEAEGTRLGEAAAGWGMEPGESGSSDPAARLALMQRLSTPSMAELAAMVGRMALDSAARTGERWEAGPQEITSVRPGNDIGMCTSSELMLLAIPAMRPLFYQRYVDEELLCLHMEQVHHEAAGAIIYIEDSSSSMAGERTLWARAVGLRLLASAAEQGRGFKAIVFSGVGSFKLFDFGADASEATVEDRLAYAEFTMRGGTDYQGPLLCAMELLEVEHDETGRTSGDVVLATDDTAGCTAEFYDAWDEAKARLGFACYGIVIHATVPDSVARLCDEVTSVDHLADGSQIANLFDAVEHPTKEHA